MPPRKIQHPPDYLRSHTQAEIDRWAYRRQPGEREKIPAPGEQLLFRAEEFAEPVPAVVTAVMDLSSPHDHWNRHGDLERARGPGLPDVHVWSWDEDRREHVLLDDPWPWVQVSPVVTDSRGRAVKENGKPVLAPPRWCREARVRGSRGWLRRGSRAHTGIYEEG